MWKNKWMNSVNKWIHDWINGMNKLMNEWVDELMNVWISGRLCAWMWWIIGWICEKVNE